jgi:hypothetical protein
VYGEEGRRGGREGGSNKRQDRGKIETKNGTRIETNSSSNKVIIIF